MAVITLPFKYLERLTRTDKKTILDRIPLIGSDVERVEEDHADVEFFPDRPDLFSPEGVARAMRGYLGIETGLPSYPVKPSGISFTVDPKLADIRPVLGAAVIRGVTFDDESIQSIMSLQESLHWAVGRGRSKVAIGIHDLDTVRPRSITLHRAGPGSLFPLIILRRCQWMRSSRNTRKDGTTQR